VLDYTSFQALNQLFKEGEVGRAESEDDFRHYAVA
jgi:hypothetical protein